MMNKIEMIEERLRCVNREIKMKPPMRKRKKLIKQRRQLRRALRRKRGAN